MFRAEIKDREEEGFGGGRGYSLKKDGRLDLKQAHGRVGRSPGAAVRTIEWP